MNKMNISEIKITNSKPGVTTIDIEGTIGVPEEWQFEEPAGRIATYDKFQKALAAISRIRGGEVVVNIRSTGGDVGDALLIYDALTTLKDAAITTRCYGYVASAATIIAQAAGEGRREISANSLYLIHNVVASCEGNARDFHQNVELLTKTDERIAAIYAERSGRELGEFALLMAENNGSGRWLSPEETLDAGLADRIVSAADETGKRVGRKKSSPPVNSTGTDALRMRQDIELEKLRYRINALENENSQLRAKPTEIKQKEDPAPTESRRSANENAYHKDAESLFYK